MRVNFPYVGAVYILLEKDGKVLLLRRFNTSYMDGHYSVPAWHMDGNETPKDAALREVLEETSVTIAPEDLHFATVIYKHEWADERFCFFFTASKWQGEITNAESHKCDDLSWFACDNLPENTIPYVKKAIQNWKAWVTYEEIVME